MTKQRRLCVDPFVIAFNLLFPNGVKIRVSVPLRDRHVPHIAKTDCGVSTERCDSPTQEVISVKRGCHAGNKLGNFFRGQYLNCGIGVGLVHDVVFVFAIRHSEVVGESYPFRAAFAVFAHPSDAVAGVRLLVVETLAAAVA